MLTPLDPWIARKIGSDERTVDRRHLERHQLEHLRSTVDLARARSSFYRRHLPDVEITELTDVTTLPFTTADDIRAGALRFLCVSQDEISRVVTLDTSGTTGAPKRLSFTPSDQELTIDFFHIGMSTFTGAGDRVLILLPGDTPGSVGDLLASALIRLGAVPIKHGPVRDATATLAVMAEERIDVVVGVPTHLLWLARADTHRTVSLKSVLATTDHVPAAVVTAIEDAWGCVVHNHYGMTEMGLGGGVDCRARRGYHLREADMLFEVIDPASGRPAPTGDHGEVVFTTLTRTGMPLIRYRTGDVSRFLTTNCPCGTELRLLEKVRFRLDGMVQTPHGTLTMPDLDETLFAFANVVDFAVSVGRDVVDVAIKASGPVDLPAASDALSRLPALDRLDVRVTVAASLPVNMGKRRISDRRRKR